MSLRILVDWENRPVGACLPACEPAAAAARFVCGHVLGAFYYYYYYVLGEVRGEARDPGNLSHCVMTLSKWAPTACSLFSKPLSLFSACLVCLSPMFTFSHRVLTLFHLPHHSFHSWPAGSAARLPASLTSRDRHALRTACVCACVCVCAHLPVEPDLEEVRNNVCASACLLPACLPVAAGPDQEGHLLLVLHHHVGAPEHLVHLW